MSGKRSRCAAAAAAPAMTAQKMILFLLNRSPEGCNPSVLQAMDTVTVLVGALPSPSGPGLDE
jgi:hypothetical protein